MGRVVVETVQNLFAPPAVVPVFPIISLVVAIIGNWFFNHMYLVLTRVRLEEATEVNVLAQVTPLLVHTTNSINNERDDALFMSRRNILLILMKRVVPVAVLDRFTCSISYHTHVITPECVNRAPSIVVATRAALGDCSNNSMRSFSIIRGGHTPSPWGRGGDRAWDERSFWNNILVRFIFLCRVWGRVCTTLLRGV